MVEWQIKLHPDFLRDLDKLDKKHLEIFYKKKEKIKQNPLRLKHLSGGENCYREPITSNIRLIYYLDYLLFRERHNLASYNWRTR